MVTFKNRHFVPAIRRGLGGVAVSAAMFLAAPTQAALLNFSVTGYDNFSFQMDSSPTVAGGGNIQFWVTNLPGTFAGHAQTFQYVNFGTQGLSGFDITADNGGGFGTYFAVNGPTLFSDVNNQPVFSTGTFALTNYDYGFADVLTISNVSAPSPLPGSGTFSLLICAAALSYAKTTYYRGNKAYNINNARALHGTKMHI